MNRNRMFFLSIIYAASITVGITAKAKNAWSNTCPFDSYIILNNKCVDLTEKLNTPSNTAHQTTYGNDYQSEPEIVEQSPEETCNDFKYQSEAQRYFDRYPEYKNKLDLDNDGYVCESLKRNNALTQEIWQTLLYKNRQKKIETENKHSLNYKQVYRIIGFSPSTKKKNNKYIWEDPISNRSIEVRFFNDEIKDMRGRGFRRSYEN